MARASPFQGNFESGEFSPLLFGRTDTPRYKTGLERCFNQIPTLQGGATRRAGTKYASTAKQNSYTRLIPFRFSTAQNFMLEFGNGYVRFYTNRGVLETFSGSGIPYEISSPYSTAQLQVLKFAQSLDTLYLTHPTIQPYKLQRFSNLSWLFTAMNTGDGPYLNQNVDQRIGITPSAATGNGITLTVTAAEVTVTDVNNNGLGYVRLTMASTATYKTGDFLGFRNCGSLPNNTCDTITVVDATHVDLQRTLFVSVSSGLTGKSNFAPFAKVTPGQPIRLLQGTIWGYAVIVIGGASNTYQAVFANVVNTLTNTNSKTAWRLGAYSDPQVNAPGKDPTTGNSFTGLGFPSCVVFHEDRLYLGGATGSLQRIDGSNVGDYENFAPSQYSLGSTTDNTTIVDSSAVSFSIGSGESSAIVWMTSDEKGMPIGTTGGPFVLRASSLGQAITPTNVSVKAITTYPSSNFAAVCAGKSSIYIEQNFRKVRELGYFYDVDGFRAVDLSELSEHLPAKGISTEIVFQNSPQNILWCARSDGTLLGITYDRTIDTLRTGWHQHQLGGVSDAAGTPPIIESLAVIPAPDAKSDDVWMSVARYINGTTIRSIEYMTKIFESFNPIQDAYFLDCGITFDNPQTIQTITTGTTTSVLHTAHGLSTGDKVRFQDVSGVVGINGFEWIITVTDANNFTIPLISSGQTWIYTPISFYRKMITTLAGITWLEGQTVSVLGDGSDLGTSVVTSGSITLSYPASVVQIGLNYSSEMKQMRLDAGAADGTSFGKFRRNEQTGFLLERTASFEYGVNFDDMEAVSFRQPSDPMDGPTPLFSGIVSSLLLRSTYDTENQICIRQKTPLPLTVLAIMPQVVTQDKS